MKNIFSIDVTDENNKITDGDIFVIQRAPKELSDKVNDLSDEVINIALKTGLPLYLEIIKVLFLIAAGIIGIVLVTLWEEMSIAEIMAKHSFLVLLAVFCGLAYGILEFIDRRRTKELMETSNTQRLESELEKASDEIIRLYNKPKDAPVVDVMFTTYKAKKITHSELCNYLTESPSAYVEDDRLYLITLNAKYGIPLKEITGAHCINKKVSTDAWNKDEPHNKGKYKEFKIKEDEYGRVCIKRYYALDILHENEDYEILIPCYDWEIIEKLTGIKATEA